jgi:RNA polymerase sigma-70 factor, ECF subfamily
VRQDDSISSDRPAARSMPGPDAPLVQRLRQGDPEAGRQFVREHYPGVYRYLLYLTGRREAAEDLTQETFLQAWRRLETFDNRGALRPWLHRIAHREFLQALRSRHPETSLEGLPEALAPPAADPAEAAELRTLLTRLPLEEREALVLHYLEGYSYQEIARIVGVPVTTVNYRLLEARARLRRELGEGDLPYLNPAPEAVLRHWTWLPLEALAALEARLSMIGKGERTMNDKTNTGMSRRQLLEAAGTAAATAAASLTSPAAAARPQNEAEIIDDRLTRKVTLAVKATALSDLCAQLHRDTGIGIVAGPSVADEKVTVFCEKLPLREVMRQLSRPFGYTWLRSGSVLGVWSSVFGKNACPNTQHPAPNTNYRYELVQDLRSQLLEEELRNRDRNAALLVLEQEIQRYRPFLDLSPDAALARAKTAPAEDKPLLEQLGRSGWGPVQIYFRLSPQQLAALRDGEELRFSQVPKPGELPLPSDVARGVLPSLRDVFFSRFPDGFGISTGVKEPKEGDLPPTAVPEARANLGLSIRQTELGRIALQYWAGAFSQSDLPRNSGGATWEGDGALAVGISPAATQPHNRRLNARLAQDPALQRRISVIPEGTCGQDPSPAPPRDGEGSHR